MPMPNMTLMYKATVQDGTHKGGQSPPNYYLPYALLSSFRGRAQGSMEIPLLRTALTRIQRANVWH